MLSFSKCQYCQKKKRKHRNLLSLLYFNFKAWFMRGRYMFWKISKAPGSWLHRTLETKNTFHESCIWNSHCPLDDLDSDMSLQLVLSILCWRDKLPFMGKIELPRLLEFLFKCYDLANWASFIKFLPSLDVEARTDRWISIRGTDLGGVGWGGGRGLGPAKKPCQLECGRCLVEAFGCRQEVQPARQNTHQHETQSWAKSEFGAGTWHWGGPEGPAAGQRETSRCRPTERTWPPTVGLYAVCYWYQACFLG